MKKPFKRFLSAFLAVVIAIPTVNVLSGWTGADGGEIVQDAKCEAAAPEGFSFEKAEEVFGEGSGTQQINLLRSGDIANASSVTISAYNFSAEYGRDYLIYVDGQPLQTAEDTSSLYNQFRDNSYIAVKDEVDKSMLEGLMEVQSMQEQGQVSTISKEELQESNSNGVTAHNLAMMDEFKIKAVQWDVDFEKGQKNAVLTIEMLEDSEAEYDEEFFLVLSSKESIGENDLVSVTIEDNEPDEPINTVSFSDTSLSVDKDSQKATITFTREGNLATISNVLLCKDETAYGYVSFNPYQDTQMVEVEAGTYQLTNPKNCCIIEPAAITVEASEGETNTTASFSDNSDLDAVPEYSPVEDTDSVSQSTAKRTSSIQGNAVKSTESEQGTVVGETPSWFPDWAKNTSTVETEDYITYMGSSSNQLFKQGGTKKNGEAKFKSDMNAYELSTSGTGSRVSTGYVYLDAKKDYDWTGIESVTGAYKVSGLDYHAEVKLGIHNVNANWRSVVDGDSGEITCSVGDSRRDSQYVYYMNNDTTNTDDGCEIYVPNGFRMNKREYLFIIADPDTTDENTPTIDYGDSRQIKKMGQGDTDKSIVHIVYQTQAGYPRKLVGYNIINGSKKTYISLNGASSFTFDKQFLKNYEKDYCFSSSYNNKNYSAFQIQPVFEKILIPSDNYEILPSELGTIKITQPSDQILYKGDTVVFEADKTEPGVKLSGVRIYGKSASDDTWRSGVMDVESDGKVYYPLSSRADYFKFQPVYDTDTDVLTVEYAEGAESKGSILADEGFVVKSDEYVINKYVPLVATPKSDKYITKWTSNGRVYYGDVFNYQLDGIKENNRFVVDFVDASNVTQSTSTLKISVYKENGSLSVYDNTYVYAPMKNVKCTITAGKTYSGYTDNNGVLTIENFTGVENGTYSVVIEDGSFFKYGAITYSKNTASYKLSMAKFEGCSFYPNKVTMAQEGTGAGSNKIQLDDESYINTNVEIYNEVNSDYTLSSMKLLYYSTDDKGNLVLVQEREIDLTNADTKIETLGKYTTVRDRVAANALPKNTKVYVSVTGKMNGEEGYTATTESIFTGYELIAEITDDSIPVLDDVVNAPGAQSAYSVNIDQLEIPILGFLDFGITGKNGGYFVRQADPNDPNVYYLVAGFAVNSVSFKGTPVDKAMAAKNMYKDMEEAEEKGDKKGDTSNTTMDGSTEEVANKEGETEAGEAKKPNKIKGYNKKTLFSLYPAVMMKWGFKAVNENGKVVMKMISMDAAFGFDQAFVMTKPFTIYGVPFYATFTIKSEVYLCLSGTYNAETSTVTEDDEKANVLYDQTAEDGINDVFFAIPYLNVGLKGGIGLNNFFDAYVTLDLSFQTMIEFMDPDKGTDGGFSFEYSGGVGGDLIIFNAEINLTGPPLTLGNEVMLEQLKPITSLYTKSTRQAGNNIENSLDPSKMKFSLKERPNAGRLFKSTRLSTKTLQDNAFKGTDVQMIKLGNGSVMAVLLADNGVAEGNANFLSAVYSISNDGGTTWSDAQFFDRNSMLQFDINVFELSDRLLITWSEGDAEKSLTFKDKDNLKAKDVAQAMNELDLKGCYLDKNTGAVLGESFVIAENTSVAMSALDAIEDSNGNVIVYYQRNKYEIEEGMNFENLTTNERTLAQAVQLSGQSNWTSTKITATNTAGDKQYRITEVVPFSHKGVNGEVLVVDRDGKLVTKDSTTGKFNPSMDDRQIFIRCYTDNNGSTKSQIIPVTSSDVSAEKIKVVSNGDELYLFWNQDGYIYYLSDFIVSSDNYDPAKCEALAVVNSTTGAVEVLENEEDFGMVATGHELLQVDSQYDVCMSSNGKVLLSFIAGEHNEEASGTADVNDIYGVVLETVQENGLKELNAIGSPVAITDVNCPIRRMDSLYLNEDDFIVAYTKLDGTQIMNSTKATVEVESNSEEAKLRIADITVPDYPLPGHDMIVAVKVANDGLGTLNAGKVVFSGIGDTVEVLLDEPLLPGEETTVQATVSVPEDFNRQTDLKVSFEGTGAQSNYKTTDKATVKYDSYFVPKQMPYLNSVHGTNKYVSQLTVTNMGNKPGVPTVTYNNFIPGSERDEDEIISTYTSGEEILPGGTAVIEHVLDNTLAGSSSMSKLQVILGDGYDQKTEGMLPDPVVIEGAIEGVSSSDLDTNGGMSADGNGAGTDTNNKTTEKKQVSVPKTSDPTNPGFVLALLMGSGAAFMYNVRRKRQEEKE